ncbi:MAG: PD-(D/E)XK nuclease family protein [Bryobacterales bacterium]|nr:PD-(D/E)XK nuclease family protein [Bryobacterales bacterium]
MNIFKVFASAKKGFQEEYASAILAWLLNPAMEHGLGYAFLAEFMSEAGKANGAPDEIGALAANLRTHLRHNSEGIAACETFLELNVKQAFIDVVVNLEVGDHRWTILIENKIFSTSASDPSQLRREYIGIRESTEARFRTDESSWSSWCRLSMAMHRSVQEEWAGLQPNPAMARF